jgi:hypothetical protein
MPSAFAIPEFSPRFWPDSSLEVKLAFMRQPHGVFFLWRALLAVWLLPLDWRPVFLKE